ncbi:MAG: choice-of-anchor Q domain-containing protein [Anaerolineales bacterium]
MTIYRKLVPAIILFMLTSLACVITDILPDPCTDDWLIAQINLANANPDLSTIDLDSGCVYEFDEVDNPSYFHGDSALPTVSTPILIHGNGATITRSTAEDTPEFRFFYIDADGSLTLEDVTVTNGYARSATDMYDSGGAILSIDGDVAITNSSFSDNFSKVSGGAIMVVRGGLSISNSDFNGNRIVRETGGGGSGGAIAIRGGTLLSVAGSDFTDNLATEGGAISTFNTNSSVTGSNFTGNETDGSGGGAIYAEISDLTISECEFSSNFAMISGGAVEFIGHYFDGYDLTLYDVNLTITSSTFTQNEGYLRAGAVMLTNAAGLTIDNSTFDGNQAASYTSSDSGAYGGAVYLNEVVEDVATLVSISDSSFYRNQSDGGAAIYDRAGSRLSITSSTFADNIGDYGPAGIQTDGNLNIINSTFSGNTGDCPGFTDGACGIAIHSARSAGIMYSTIVENTGPESGAAVLSQGGVVKINGSIIANNVGGDCGTSEGGSLGSSSAGLDSDGSCRAPITDDPLVGPLADNGGPTQTRALHSGSPAIDAGPANCVSRDQRGVLRPYPSGGNCDLGAYEVSMPMVEYPSDLPPVELITPTNTSFPAWSGTILVDTLCTRGPDPAFENVSSLAANTSVDLVGISEQGSYIVVDNPRYPGVNCYVREDKISVDAEVLALLPTLPDPRPPTSTPTAEPTPTATSPPANGSISGVVFQDGNSNGNQDINDAGMSGVTVYLGQGACSSSGYQSQVTSGSGAFNFTNLPAGTYCLSVNIPLVCGTYSSPTTATQYTIVLSPGGSVYKLFGFATFPC